MAPQEQARLLAELRRARRGHWLAIHILLLLTLHRSPSEIAAFLLCARSTVYAVAQDWQKGRRWLEPASPGGPPCFTPSLRRSLLALLKKTPAAYGWCRTRNHWRKRMRDLVADGERHWKQNGPWPYRLSELYQEAEVTRALRRQAARSYTAVA